MGFANSWRTEQNDISALREVASSGQFINESTIQTGLGSKVKVLESLGIRKSSKLDIHVDRLALTLLDLAFKEIVSTSM